MFNIVSKDQKEMVFQIFSDTKNSDLSAIINYSSTKIEIKEDSYIEITGIIQGEQEFTNTLGGKLSSPKISATSIKIIDVISIWHQQLRL